MYKLKKSKLNLIIKDYVKCHINKTCDLFELLNNLNTLTYNSW